MKKLECDRCGNQVDPDMSGEWTILTIEGRKGNQLGKTADLCSYCTDSVLRLIREGVLLKIPYQPND